VKTASTAEPAASPTRRSDRADLELRFGSTAPFQIRLVETPGGSDAHTRLCLHAPPGATVVESPGIDRVADALIMDLDGSSCLELVDTATRRTLARIDARCAAFQLQGGARVSASGDLCTLLVRIDGRGVFGLRGVAEHADFVILGSGQIGVTRVRQTLRQLIVGSGRVAVSFPPPDPPLSQSPVAFGGGFSL
jgi:hypothetical protein